jgi:hypothetical protein
MTNISRMLLVGAFLAVLPLRAVYAPIPEPEQGKDLLVTVRGGVSHDTNLFGAASNAVASTIFTVAPRVTYNRSLTDQTFFSAGYGLALDYFLNRPGDKLLDSHDATARLAHAFTRSTTLDVFDMLTVSRNPESALPGVGALPGVTLNVDQSFTRNQLDGRFTTPLSPKAGLTVKARSIYYEFRDEALGRSLDRIENLYGVSGDYTVLPEIKVIGEYRHQDVYYRKLGEFKNKNSDYLMGGVDYSVAKRMSVSGRLGAEWRNRAAERDTTAPYAELSGKYDLTERSFFVGGYVYTFEETSDTLRFTDTKVHRFFANVQHALTPLIVASGSLTYEPSVLQGRRGQPNVDEESVRFGTAASYLPNKNWTVSISYDYDRVNSDDAPRNLRRERVGLNAMYSF